MSISVDPEQTAPIGEVSSGSTLLASILNSSVMLGNYLKQTTSEDDIFRCNFFLGALRVKLLSCQYICPENVGYLLRLQETYTMHTDQTAPK